MDLYIYIDESGSIPKPKTSVRQNDIFVISVIITKKPVKLARHFRKGVSKLIAKNQKFQTELSEKSEIKGSHIEEKKKTIIFSEIANHCYDYTEIGIIELHNKFADDKFRTVPARAFNYLIWKFLVRYYFKYNRICDNDINAVHIVIDERNVAPKATHNLEGYLEMKNFEMPKPLFSSVDVTYVDSTTALLVQFADMVANSYWRWLRFKESGTQPNSLMSLNKFLVNNNIFHYPLKK